MKKSIIALAVAAALATPLAAQADTILYGSARVSVDYNDEDTSDTIFSSNSNANWDVVNNDSRMGVLGSEDLGGGLSAIYQYEFGVDVTEGGNFESNRPKFVGLKGGFGSLTVGTQETPYYHVAGITDIFNSSKTFASTAWLGGSFNGFDINLKGDVRGEGALTRLDNSIYYTTPDFNGFSAEAMLVMDGSVNNNDGYSDNIDIWNIAAKYSNGPFFAGVSYIELDGDSNVRLADRIRADLDLDQWVLGLGYTSGPFNVGFIYEQGTLNTFGFINNLKIAGFRTPKSDDATNYYLTASYTFGNNVLSAAYGQLDPGTDGVDKIDNYLVGYQYNLSKRTRLWVEYIGRSGDDFFFGDQNAVSIGTRVDF